MILALKLSAGYLLKSRLEACFSIKVDFYIITLFCLAAHNYNGSEADSNCEQMCFLHLNQRHLNKSCESHFETWISISAVRKYSWAQFPANMDQTSPPLTSTELNWKPLHLKRDDDDETKQILWTQKEQVRSSSFIFNFRTLCSSCSVCWYKLGQPLCFQLLAFWLELQYKWYNQMTLVEKALRVPPTANGL